MWKVLMSIQSGRSGLERGHKGSILGYSGTGGEAGHAAASPALLR